MSFDKVDGSILHYKPAKRGHLVVVRNESLNAKVVFTGDTICGVEMMDVILFSFTNHQEFRLINH
jgi:hypothetical protein